ncbi:hypothetical protein, partial [Roseovarius sp. D0-M9]|uniref:hypothetical protein n=1 Tax=Roseovarius sp. D0-M9 TaxID=3127117 RepID=UPI00300FE030
RSAQAPARVTLRHNIWCGRELTGDPHTHTNREEARSFDIKSCISFAASCELSQSNSFLPNAEYIPDMPPEEREEVTAVNAK